MSTSTPRTPRARRGALALAAALVVGGLLAPTPPPVGAAQGAYTATGRVSVTSSGAETAQSVGSVVALSADGRFATFTSHAALAPGDTNGEPDVYLRDRLGGTTTRVSLTDADTQIQGPSHVCAMSRSARFVAFVAAGTGLPVPATPQIYVRDRTLRTTTIVSVDSSEDPSALAGGGSGIYENDECAISDDGRYVAFQSEDGDLAPSASHDGDIFRRDRVTGTTILANAPNNGGEPNGSSWDVAMSGDGSVVAFTSEANNLIATDTNGDADVFIRIIGASVTQRMSALAGGSQVEGSSSEPSISADGLKVAFTSHATNLVAGDTNGDADVFVRNRQAGTVVRASLGDSGQIDEGGSKGDVSDDGRFVAFAHYSSAVLPGDANQDDDVLRRDLALNDTDRVSVARSGSTGNDQSYVHAISGDGSAVAFTSDASDLVRNDTNQSEDVFVRAFRVETTPFADRGAFLHQQFLDFVGRAPTAAEGEAWTLRLDHGEIGPEQVIDELAHSTAWAGKRAPVIRLYWAFFLRVPDKPGMEYWIAQAQGGLSLPKMATKFAQSPEFKTKYGPLSNSAFVTKVYENVLDRSPEPAGLAYWKGQLDSGAKTRGDVMVGFSESPEGRAHIAPATDSVLVWLGMMRTVPPKTWSIGGVAEGYDVGEPPEIIPEAILDRADYAARVS